MPTLQTYFSQILSKLKHTQLQRTPDLYVLNWKLPYDVKLFMRQSRQQQFAEFQFVWFVLCQWNDSI